jgi:integrase
MALRWKDVNLVDAEMTIRQGRVRGIEADPKTGSGRRAIYLPPRAMQALQQQHAKSKQLSGAREEDYVFTSKKGLPYNKHLDKIWRDALKDSGIRHRSSYQLRHSYATRCLRKGIDPLTLSGLLGHKDPSTTFRHYAQILKTGANIAAKKALSELYPERCPQECDRTAS